MDNCSDESHVNIGVGEDLTIRELAEMVQDAVGFRGDLAFDTAKPDGTPRKLVDPTLINGLGWRARIPLKQGFG